MFYKRVRMSLDDSLIKFVNKVDLPLPMQGVSLSVLSIHCLHIQAVDFNIERLVKFLSNFS